jgi:hypothetical protein
MHRYLLVAGYASAKLNTQPKRPSFPCYDQRENGNQVHRSSVKLLKHWPRKLGSRIKLRRTLKSRLWKLVAKTARQLFSFPFDEVFPKASTLSCAVERLVICGTCSQLLVKRMNCYLPLPSILVELIRLGCKWMVIAQCLQCTQSLSR